MPRWVSVLLIETGRTVRYLYFLRFALMLWLFAPLLVVLNGSPRQTEPIGDTSISSYPLRSFLSGIVTPEQEAQFLCVAFFVVSAGFVALVAARLVTINGNERFQARPPFVLRWLLAHEERHGWLWESAVVLLSQAPGIYVLHYLLKNSHYEHVYCNSLRGILIGCGLAVAFWWVINAAFYATFELRPGDPAPPDVTMGTNAARTILLPRWCFGLTAQGKLLNQGTLEGVRSPLRSAGMVPGFGWMGKLLLAVAGPHGYIYRSPDGRLYEAHAFHIPAVIGAILLYLAMCPLTAPVPMVTASWISYGVFLVLPGLAALWIFWWSSSPVAGYGLIKWKILFTLAIVGFLAAIPVLYMKSDPERFPPFALILLTAIASLWALSWVAFFADRFRVPVLTTVALLVFLLNGLGVYRDKEEHFVSTATAQPGLQLESPQEILAALRSNSPGRPVIVVTATGGGLHASAWTASVLSRLETAFADAKDGTTPFHEHLLLASTVSGGSVGLMTYLDALQKLPAAKGAFLGKEQADPMIAAAQCSSLEAVTWGLVYYDMPRAYVPLLPLVLRPSSGVDDQFALPLGKDRTWALRKGFARNLRNVYCQQPESDANNLQADLDKAGEVEATERSLSLANLAGVAKDFRVPAFTMNTTTVEGGTRMLLANYKMPADSVSGANESFPAESFLEKYYAKAQDGSLADLPLASAAQMSATFPYVSSASRVPVKVDPDGLHFVDGGYYDNDGTSSAIEFLRSALEKQASAGAQSEAPLNVILVEIRNSPEAPSDRPGESSTLWKIGNQLMGPISSFYSAGHESVTQRNRVALDLFEKAYTDKVHLKRLVFADNNAASKVETDPLNWSLTPWQRLEVQTSADSLAGAGDYRKAAEWFYDFDARWQGEQAAPSNGPGNGPAKVSGGKPQKRH
ncbi:MAG TPA: hypothetical protein VHZ52_12800 [Acidobacteriaceae bacterium]|jgi:hypothetical protein|nr:hypothetical protein [Acidobacteriaceae bacterium]